MVLMLGQSQQMMFGYYKYYPYICKMKRFKLIITITIACMIAWQSYQIYQIEKQLDAAEKSGQLKCKRPK